MIKLQTLFLLSITYSPSIICQIPNNCNQSCPGSEFTQVPYPFGFSSGCKIQLNCTSNGTVSIGEFPVWQFSSDGLLVNLSTKCGRIADALSVSYSDNYAPISTNRISWPVRSFTCLVFALYCMLCACVSFDPTSLSTDISFMGNIWWWICVLLGVG